MAETIIPQWTTSDRLVKARESAGWSQQQLAERLRMHKRTVARREAETEPKLEYVYAVCDACAQAERDYIREVKRRERGTK